MEYSIHGTGKNKNPLTLPHKTLMLQLSLIRRLAKPISSLPDHNAILQTGLNHAALRFCPRYILQLCDAHVVFIKGFDVIGLG